MSNEKLKRTDEKASCLFPECRNIGEFRGLCKSHYTTARKMVALGEATWAALEHRGKALPAARGGAKPTVREWFLEESAV